MNLPRRVAVAFMPGRLATKIFTSPAKIDSRYASWLDRPAAASLAPLDPQTPACGHRQNVSI
ncbi:hypothetical protein BN2475_1300003 [Paraburkholderia ribeironis]|uniref:Uncharacterized protein n=1 Tax=Paraburkholderia ribeironis TaxID=1247936 RepID=A0A1N7SPF6_9BURK|nr:hypothetical protein BN2475_1300003 [Paraburkholderia ribeironis]